MTKGLSDHDLTDPSMGKCRSLTHSKARIIVLHSTSLRCCLKLWSLKFESTCSIFALLYWHSKSPQRDLSFWGMLMVATRNLIQLMTLTCKCFRSSETLRKVPSLCKIGRTYSYASISFAVAIMVAACFKHLSNPGACFPRSAYITHRLDAASLKTCQRTASECHHLGACSSLHRNQDWNFAPSGYLGISPKPHRMSQIRLQLWGTMTSDHIPPRWWCRSVKFSWRLCGDSPCIWYSRHPKKLVWCEDKPGPWSFAARCELRDQTELVGKKCTGTGQINILSPHTSQFLYGKKIPKTQKGAYFCTQQSLQVLRLSPFWVRFSLMIPKLN